MRVRAVHDVSAHVARSPRCEARTRLDAERSRELLEDLSDAQRALAGDVEDLVVTTLGSRDHSAGHVLDEDVVLGLLPVPLDHRLLSAEERVREGGHGMPTGERVARSEHVAE